MDFIGTHFYGDFGALAGWLGTLNEYYNTNQSASYKMWITEIALPQQNADATEVMMNKTLPYLDQLDYVERYSWFGIYRKENANGWVGSGAALLDNSGRLTDLGALYLGSPFKAGLSASDASPDQHGSAGKIRNDVVRMTLTLTLILIAFIQVF